ncbi:MAG: ATP-binding protein [Bacteroidales bacterium]|jgi:hypothetical protein|nr:ATP-binding protein [Bacteroidales bacterium]
MKYDIDNYSDTDVLTTTEENDITLSKDSQTLIFQMFSKNIYSNPIGSVVREITSNCFDSHTEAKINAPVLIRNHQDKSTGTHYISFIDYGVGMSPERIRNIFSIMFNSTKRHSNEQIGAYGLGSKSPLAYKRKTGLGEGEYDNSYNIITVYNNIKYIYNIYEGKNSPRISKLHEEETTEKNGTEIQIPVLEKDIATFAKEMVRQLYYFENIIFEGFEDTYQYQNNILSNDYQIIRGKNFLFRGEDYNNNIHVCLGKVAYPIDYDALDLRSSDYSLPIALKLEVGDIGVTVNRETLDYSETTIKMLKKKLESAKNEIIELITEQYDDIVTLKQYFQAKYNFGKLKFPNNKSLYVGHLFSQKDVNFSNFKYQYIKMPNDKQLFRFFFETKTYGKKPRRNCYGGNREFEGGYKTIVDSNNLLFVEEEFNRKIIKQSYLKSEYETYYVIRKHTINNWMRSEIADMFNVHIDDIVNDKGHLIPFIQELTNIQEEYFDIVRENAQDYDELEVPEDFIANRKRKNSLSTELRKKSIPVKFVGGYSKERVQLSKLFDYNMPIFYGTSDDEYKLIEAVKLLFDNNCVVNHTNYSGNMISGGKKSIVFMQVAKNNTKYLKHCKNARPIQDFFTYMLPRKNDMIQEYFQTYTVIEKYEGIAEFYRKGFIHRVDENWGKKVDVINTIINKIPDSTKDSRIKHYRNEISKYFNLDKITPTKEQDKFCKLVDEIEELQENNRKTLSYFNLPWEVEQMDAEQISILQLAMNLS